MTANEKFPLLFLSAPHPCPYLEQEVATTLVIDPDITVAGAFYSILVQKGFRRSGEVVYRPHCGNCRQCISVRIDTQSFKMNRSQRRIWNKNVRSAWQQTQLKFCQEHFVLYQQYQAYRHPDSSMNDPKMEKYEEFILTSSVDSCLFELKENNELLAVSLVDRLKDGLSAVYTFFRPDLEKRSLGTYSILWQIKLCQNLGLPWLYLGYWIEECRKMEYKIKFRPINGFVDNQWQFISRQ